MVIGRPRITEIGSRNIGSIRRGDLLPRYVRICQPDNPTQRCSVLLRNTIIAVITYLIGSADVRILFGKFILINLVLGFLLRFRFIIRVLALRLIIPNEAR